MSTKSLKPNLLPPLSNNLPQNLEPEAGSWCKFWSGLERIITTSQDRKIVINITINAPSGGGATVNWKSG